MKVLFVLAATLALALAAPQVAKQSRSLEDDLNDILALIPVEDIKAVLDEHVENDGAAATVILYLQGQEWADLVATVAAKPAVQELITYLTDAGLPIDDWIALIHNTIAGLVPGAEPDEDGSLRPLLDEIEALLPVEDLVSMINDKLQNSADVQELYSRISSQKAHDLVEEVRAIDEVQRLAARLTEMGVKVEEALALIYDFLGWGKP